ncbi:MAG: choline kinase, partial [Myxococcota bacterium]
AALAAVPTTLVHGDAKVANFCFGDAGVAAVDFQYVGGGCGLKDVAYFLGSCLDDAALRADAESWLVHYFRRLDVPDVETAWRRVWPHAWADFERFLAGWAPDHWKRTGFAAEMTADALGDA